MAPRSTFVALLLLSACSTPVRRGDRGPAVLSQPEKESPATPPSKSVVEQSEHPRTRAFPAPPSDEAVRTVTLPPGITCAMHGTGAPFSNGCRGQSLAVSSSREGGKPLAQFGTTEIDITWAFFEGRGKSWVSAQSHDITVEGFVDASDERFALEREITAVDAHVWFKDDAPVVVRGGLGTGVRIALKGDTTGVDTIVAEAPCDALRYEPVPRTRSKAPQVAREEPHKWGIPSGKVLPIRWVPGGPVQAVLSDPEALRFAVGVLESHLGYSRVTFDTDFARFDVWVDDRTIDTTSGRGSGFGSGGGCGGSPDYMAQHLWRIVADTPITVAAVPGVAEGPRGVSIAHDARVIVEERKNGFARIRPFISAIYPPDNLHFWVPESAVEEIAKR